MVASIHEPVARSNKALKVNHFSFVSCDLVFICYLHQVACLLGVARGNSQLSEKIPLESAMVALPIILALRSWSQKDQDFRVILSYRPTWAT